MDAHWVVNLVETMAAPLVLLMVYWMVSKSVVD